MAGHSGSDGAEDVGDDGAAAWLWDRAASQDRLVLNYGTLYPALLRLEQEGHITSQWGVSTNNRRAKFYRLTRAGRRQLEREAREWEQATAILARFLRAEEGPS